MAFDEDGNVIAFSGRKYYEDDLKDAPVISAETVDNFDIQDVEKTEDGGNNNHSAFQHSRI